MIFPVMIKATNETKADCRMGFIPTASSTPAVGGHIDEDDIDGKFILGF